MRSPLLLRFRRSRSARDIPRRRPERLFGECSHFCELVNQPAQMPRLARVAVQPALGRGGGAVLVLLDDVLHQPAAHPTG
jgi:pyruvate dehydrogenase (quinone)